MWRKGIFKNGYNKYIEYKNTMYKKKFRIICITYLYNVSTYVTLDDKVHDHGLDQSWE